MLLAFFFVNGDNAPRLASHQASFSQPCIFTTTIFTMGRISMRGLRVLLFASLTALLVPVQSARAETKIELKGVHLCCQACTAAVVLAVRDLDGVQVGCDRKNRRVPV